MMWGDIEIPVELEESYPVQQSIFAKSMLNSQKKYLLPGETTLRNYNLEKIRFLADYQFGAGSGKNLFPDSCDITVSKSTGRIRTIQDGGKILATMRVHDGYLALTMEGGERIRMNSPGMKNRVKVTEESASFNAQGKSVFFNFIIDCDLDIIPYGEVLVVDPSDNLVAVGKALTSGIEMKQYRKGIAVTINHHRK